MQRLLFSSELEKNSKPVNVASVPQRSPFRYPGGKTWFVPKLREWIRNQKTKPKLLIEPFVGGGIISLTAAFEDLVESVLMVEIDEEIAAVWQSVISGEANWLAERIMSFEISKEGIIEEINRTPREMREKAFQTILKNRTFHGGILAAGAGFLKNGEAGKGILSRWYPSTLAKRLRDIDLVKEKLNFEHGNAFDILAHHRDTINTIFFVDPPYTAGGKKAGSRLYRHYELDHRALFEVCISLKGNFIMTYDNTQEVRQLAKKYGLHIKPIPMKNNHHAEMTELVIGRNLEWLSDAAQ